MPDDSAYRFGWREGRALSDLPSDAAFLSWQGGHNAALVLCSHAEDALLHQNADSIADRLDRAMLALSLAGQWASNNQDSPVLAYVRTLREIDLDETRSAAWHEAVEKIGQGAQLHRSDPVRALDFYGEALKRFEDLGDEKGAGRARGNIGLLLLDHQQVEDGLRECMTALRLHANVHYDRGCLMHLFNLIGAAQKIEHWEDALNLGRQRAFLAERSDPTGAAACYADVGWFAWQLGRRDDADQAYQQAVAALERVMTPAGLRRQIDSLGPLAHALGHAAELQDRLPRLQQQINSGLQSLDVQHLRPAATILRAFTQAIDSGDHDAIYKALAQSESWSALAFEQLLAQQAIATLIEEREAAGRFEAQARQFALAYSRSFLDRGPFDEYALFTAWTQEQRLVKARAYALKLEALDRGNEQARVAASEALVAAFRLHQMIGTRDAGGVWFAQAMAEIAVEPESRTGLHRLMFRASQEALMGSAAGERQALDELLALATDEGTTLDLADAHTRLGIHCSQAGDSAGAATWFAQAEQSFRALEAVGISVREEAGRAHNKLKMQVHLLEWLEQVGRYGEAAYVGVAALREADWYVASFEHPEYRARTIGYKSRMLHALARSYERLGGYEQSLAYAGALCAWAEDIGERSALAAGHHSSAVALRALLNLPAAMTSARADLAIQRELGDRREIAVALVMCAELAMDIGDAAEARAFAAEAIDIAGTAPSAASSRRDALYVLARIEEQANRPDEAIRLYAEVLSEEEKAGAPGWIATAGTLAERFARMNRQEEGLALARRAWDAAASVHSPSLRLGAGCALAKCLLPAGTPDALQQAIDVLLECCRLVETIRGEMTDDTHRTSAAVAWVLPFEMLLSTLLSVVAVDPDPAWARLAFDVAERAKARALAESIAASAARDAAAQGFRLTGMQVRLVDPREQIRHVEFDVLRDVLRGSAAAAG